MHMHSCSLFFFLSLLSFCGAVAKLPDSTSWGAFLAKVLQASTCFACLTSFYIYSSAPGFLPLPVELSQTFVLAFDCTGLQLASPKSAFVHGGGAGVCVRGCACVCLSIPDPCYLHMVCVPVILQQSLCSLPLQDVFMNQIFSVILLM